MAIDETTLFIPFAQKMLKAGVHETVIRSFRRHFTELLTGQSGMMPGSMIDPVPDLPDAMELDGYADAGRAALPHTVVIKLNGGLGTSMGLEKAKSLLPAKNGLSFLEIIARQAEHLSRHTGVDVPLILMNTILTREDSLRVLDEHLRPTPGIPRDFLQHRVPKILAQSHEPAEWPDFPELEWCPPGHGDLYAALATSGLLEMLLARGRVYAFISNSDNLGAVLDEEILGYFAAEQLDFMMEVADRTAADRKGGHLARRRDGRLTLREVAQCPAEEMEEFQNICLHRHFNTNSLWVNLRSLKELLDAHAGVLPLPVIPNLKTLDPRDPRSPRVYQLETAMGAAISLFDRAVALRVPRTRFSPVKTTDDLLGLWSDAFILTEGHRVIANPARQGRPLRVVLDRMHYQLIDQLHHHFPHGAPSLVGCNALTVEGNVVFGRGVRIIGDVTITAPGQDETWIPDGEIIRRD